MIALGAYGRARLDSDFYTLISMTSLLFAISPLDLLTYAGGIVLLGLVSAVACWTPAWRAAQVDPAITLRAE